VGDRRRAGRLGPRPRLSVRAGTGKKAKGADQLGGIDAIRASTSRRSADRQRVLTVRATTAASAAADQVHPTTAAQPGAGGRSRARRGDKVVGIVGNTSFAERDQLAVLRQGVRRDRRRRQAECFGTPSFAESNMGPR
jgi:hypothetical protein